MSAESADESHSTKYRTMLLDFVFVFVFVYVYVWVVLRRFVGEPLRILRQIVGVFFPIDYEFVFFATGSLSTTTSKVNTQKNRPSSSRRWAALLVRLL